jgi:galactokinase
MTDISLHDRVVRAFRARFLREPDIVVRAPGRVNLIGEHTDYNDGFVLPMAVDRAAWVAAGTHQARTAVLRALDMRNDEVVFPVDQVPPSGGGWSDYPRALIWRFLEEDLKPFGLDAVLSSDVPVGAGMSSSAALELAFAYAWSVVSGFGLDPDELALLAQRSENEYVGVRCGIMDQMISACGKAEHAMLLDTRTLKRYYVPLPSGTTVVVADSKVRRSLATSEYNVRRAQCEHAVQLLQQALPEIEALRDVSLDQLEEHRDLLPEVVYRRARHVITENYRVRRAVLALRKEDLEEVGQILLEGHRSLQEDYEVSAPELDLLVDAAVEVPGCHGARLTGAGFGGCIIALVEEGAVPALKSHLLERYEAAFDREAAIYDVHPAEGVERVDV